MRIRGRDFPELMSALVENMSEGFKEPQQQVSRCLEVLLVGGGRKSCAAERSVNARLSPGL